MEGKGRAAQRDLRVLVFSGLHLDRAFPWAAPADAAKTRAAQEASFEAICAIGAAEADVLVSAGDLYDYDRHHPDTAELLRAAFERLAPLPVLLIPGETDPLTQTSLYEQVRWSSNVHVCRDAEQFEPIPGLAVLSAPPGQVPPIPEGNPGEIRLLILQNAGAAEVAELEAREDISHMVLAGTPVAQEGERSSSPGGAHPAEPWDPPGGFEFLTVGPDATVSVNLRSLGTEAPPLPWRRFSTDELETPDLAAIGEEQTVRGEFVRTMLTPEDSPVHLRRLALLAGLLALEGKAPER